MLYDKECMRSSQEREEQPEMNENGPKERDVIRGPSWWNGL